MANEAFYYNEFDPAKKYFEVRALAGFVEQSREDNEIQAMLKHLIKLLGDSLYKNGSLVSGGNFSTGASNTNLIQMQEAKIWYNGIIHTVPAKDITITGSTGVSETIGVLITESVVTYSSDSELLDPAVEADNYGQPGANRLKIEATWELDAVDQIPFYTFLGGIQQTQPVIGEIDPVSKTLQRRTYDESGNYVVAGFEMRVEPLSDDQVNLVVGNFKDSLYSGSKAYVRGVEIVKLLPDTLPIDKAKTTRQVEDERFIYQPSNPASPTASEMRLKLGRQPGGKITKVSATFDIVRTVNSHNFNGKDELAQPGETLIDIITAYKGGTVGSPALEYAKSTTGASGPGGDYYKDGTGISWNVTGSVLEPTNGDTYTAYILVRRTLSESEYTLYTDGDGITYCDISPLVTKPYAKNLRTNTNTSSDVDVDYKFYLPRIDTIYLNDQGVIGVVPGAPDTAPVAPQASGAVLSLGQLKLAAGGTAAQATIVPFDVKRLTMLELRKLLNRLERAEYNQAVKDLNDEGVRRAGNSIATLKGILTESFTYTSDDIKYDGVGGVSKIKFVRQYTTENALNVRDRLFSLPELETRKELTVAASGTTADITNSEDSVTLGRLGSPYYYAAEQSLATDAIQINQYDVFLGNPQVKIAPSEVMGRETDNTVINTFDPTNIAAVVQSLLPDRATFSGTTNALVNSTGFSKEFNAYMPVTWVWVYGTNYPVSTRVDLKFDGRPVRLTANAGTAGRPYPFTEVPSPASTFTGSPSGNIYPTTSYVITNNKGEFSVAIEVPAGVPSGTVSVLAEAVTGQSAAAEFSNDAKIKFVEHATSTLAKPLAELVTPPLPIISSVTVRATSNLAGSVTNITGSTALVLDVVWSQAGGTPDVINVSLSPLSTGNVFTKSRSEFTTTELDTRTVRFAIGTLDQAFDYRVNLINGKGTSQPTIGTITRLSVAPTSVNSTFGTIGLKNVPTVSGRGVATAFWNDISGDFNKIIITNNNFSATPIVLTGAQLAVSGEQTIDIVSGSNVITFQALGPAGNSFLRTVSINVPTPPNVRRSDPIAQTFTLDADAFVEGIDLFFSTVPSTGSNTVTIEIRDTQGGSPIAQLIDEAIATVPLSAVQTSSTAATPTYFKFARPIYLEGKREYCIVVKTDDPDYRVFYAKLGNTLVGTSTTLSVQPAQGVMLQSANNSTWSPLNDSDLKYRIKAVKFKSDSILYFENVAVTNMVGMHLAVSNRNLVLPGQSTSTESPCQIFWDYQLNGTGAWLPFEPDAYVYFDQLAATVQVRARLVSKIGEKITPRLPKVGTALNVLTRSLTSTYVTKTATFAEAYRYVRMIAKQDQPAGATIRWYVSDNTAQPGSVSAWSGATTYALGAIVSKSGNTYQALQGSNLNQDPVTQTAYWTLVSFLGSVVWREIPSLGETKTIINSGPFYEHERVFDLGVNSGRTSLRFRLELSVPAAINTLVPPKVTDVMVITTT